MYDASYAGGLERLVEASLGSSDSILGAMCNEKGQETKALVEQPTIPTTLQAVREVNRSPGVCGVDCIALTAVR